MQYAYTARSIGGETAKGTVLADSPVQAQQQLRQQGLFPLAIAPAASRAGRVASRSSRRRRVSRKDRMAFTSQLAIMCRSGIDVAGAIQSLARQCANPTLKATLDAVHQDVTSGLAFSAALRNQADVFGEAYVASITAGEASGRLADVLARLAAMERAEVRLVSTRRALLAYPLVLIAVSSLVILGLMFFVLPEFANVFDQFGMPLPVITQVLLGISTELRRRWWLWVVLAPALVVGLGVWRRSPAGRRFVDGLLLSAVLVRDVTRSILTGRSFRLLGIMLESGVPLVDALRLTRSSIANTRFRELFDRLENDVLNGRPLAEGLASAPFVPGGAAEMIATAERTGTLSMVAEIIGEYYEDEGETRLRELATMIEPIIIVVMGIVVACVVLAVMLPMFDFASFAQHGA